MKTKIIFVLPLIVLLFSCAKERTIKVSAINPATGEGYTDLRIRIFESKTGSEGEELTQVYQGYLNDSGELYATFKVKKGVYYLITCQSPPNTNVCYTNNTTYTYSINAPNNKEFIFEIAPCAQLKLNIQNVNCEGPNDHFKLFYNGRQVGGQDGLIGAVVKDEYGCYTFEQGHWSDVPMGKRYYKWEVTRSSGTTVFYDTVNLNQGEQKVYNINY